VTTSMRAFAVGLALMLALAPVARAAGPLGVTTPWAPANAGVLWWQPNDPDYPFSLPRQPPGDAQGAWWLTRRIVLSPHVPGVFHLGSFFHGMYGSATGTSWASLNPGCWLPVNPPAAAGDARDAYAAARRAAIAVTGLDACGIEGIVYDPVLPNRMYATAYDIVRLQGVDATLGDGGVYASDNLGVSWRKLRGGFRGNGLAVHRSGPATTIAAGFIQAGSSVGATPSNGSLTISRDGGATWTDVTLPPSD